MNTCHWPGCPKLVPAAIFMCRAHWTRLPQPLRDAIGREYRPGSTKSETFLATARLVQDWIAGRINVRKDGSVIEVF